MIPTIHVSCDVLRYPKVQMLKREYGAGGVLAVLGLWLCAGEFRPDGVFRDAGEALCVMDKDPNDPEAQEFLRFLVEHQFLDEMPEGGYRIHHWSRHQPFLTSRQQEG